MDRPVSLAGVGFALQPHLSEFLGVEVTFEHITGGFGGSNGPRAAAKADPNGYTLLMGTIGNISLLPNILSDYSIDPIKCFTPVTKIAVTPNILVVRPGLNATSLEDILKLSAKKSRNIEISWN